jgi:transposase
MSRRRGANGPSCGGGLKRLRTNVAGIDLGAREHWVCGPQREAGRANVQQFRTTTPELKRLVAWLQEEGVESVAMESTSVYWIPLYEVLEAAGLEVVLVNARHLSGVPGRKSDMVDCQWLQLLHSCGLLKGSFRPSEAICRLRALQRERSNLVAERTRIVQRMQKALDQMNVHVHHAVTDLTGKTGLGIVRAIVAGERNPLELAKLRDARCQQSLAQIAEHLTGTWRAEHLFNLQMGLRRFDEINRIIAEYEAQLHQWIAELQPPERRAQCAPAHPSAAKERAIAKRGERTQREALWRWAGVDLTRIDGLSAPGAAIILTEVGLNLRTFPDEQHFISWLRLSPKTASSAGKPIRAPHRNATGATRVAAVLRMAALALTHSQTALGAYYRRIARRKGAAVAIFATARKLAQLVFRTLRYGQEYVDEGVHAYEARFQQQQARRLTETARQLGYKLVPIHEAA